MTVIAISRVHYPVTTLGPGNRVGIWMQGCLIRCPGCISADTWAEGRGKIEISSLMDQVAEWLPQADGITVSGGEPFDQPDALHELLGLFRAKTTADILVYSGYPLESITANIDQMTGLIDALISDPFLLDGPQSLALRGSDNQRMHCLTALGEQRFRPYRDLCDEAVALDVMFDDDGSVWFAGIPKRSAWRSLQQSLKAAGHSVLTSQDASVRGPGALD